MSVPIRGLTLLNPWPFCVTRLGKGVENRSWHPRERGGCTGMFLAIHGAKLPKGEKLEMAHGDLQHVMRLISTWEGGQRMLRRAWWDTLTDAQQTWVHSQGALKESDFFTPGIVALARIRAVNRHSDSLWATTSGWHWDLADVTPIRPLAYVGKPDLWDIDAYTLDLLRAAYAEQHDGLVLF